MLQKPLNSLRILKIEIQNYKGIDNLELEFPPSESQKGDVTVIGSENGLGKTSVIECCVLLLLTAQFSKELFRTGDHVINCGYDPDTYLIEDYSEILIRAGADFAELRGEFLSGDKEGWISLRIYRPGSYPIAGGKAISDYENLSDYIPEICGSNAEPMIEDNFMLFNSYRKVREGRIGLGSAIEKQEQGISFFKQMILRSLMDKADLFEQIEGQKEDDTIEKLNSLLNLYAGGNIGKLRTAADNTVDIRIKPQQGGDSFSFDGLSSGQKEIISTLFMIWEQTRHKPSIIFIDEPELHLNAQWHRLFVNGLIALAPQNQYIMATHSEDIMDSVDEECRVLLFRQQGGNK